MSGSHGDLFREIGKLVLAAHAGQAIDLSAKSEELAERYDELGMPPELIAKAIARSLGAISVSMAIISDRGANGHHAKVNGHSASNGNGGGANGLNGHQDEGHADEAVHANGVEEDVPIAEEEAKSRAKAASALFPSGLRLAYLR
jgi:hypothetical protein